MTKVDSKMKDVTRNEIQLALKQIILIVIIQIPTKQHVSPRMLAQKYPFFPSNYTIGWVSTYYTIEALFGQ